MKNKIIISNDENKEEYKLLLKVDIDNITYVIYTLNEENECNDIICYAAIYKKEKGRQYLMPIEDEYMIELLDSILMQVQNLANKKDVD